ncbi:hypothetical protein [Photobacterium leiognathi]|uniref:Uncharacterized protein n=1 Tax=Photobacterium leiognathi TaxID=553611 RepID=A0A2T3M7I1_PHOLE|nr:hypothetical protein [Photobacterium leiognathi]KJF97425.1 hypothetical protein UB34_12965 [Photobacterium leiognathi]PSV88229.1 hypothetical protein CTM89_14715 [Photobacterium leiognathi]
MLGFKINIESLKLNLYKVDGIVGYINESFLFNSVRLDSENVGKLKGETFKINDSRINGLNIKNGRFLININDVNMDVDYVNLYNEKFIKKINIDNYNVAALLLALTPNKDKN